MIDLTSLKQEDYHLFILAAIALFSVLGSFSACPRPYSPPTLSVAGHGYTGIGARIAREKSESASFPIWEIAQPYSNDAC